MLTINEIINSTKSSNEIIADICIETINTLSPEVLEGTIWELWDNWEHALFAYYSGQTSVGLLSHKYTEYVGI